MTNINVRIDEKTKNQAEKIVNELGLNMSTAINIFLKQIIITNSIPFDLKLKPNAETLSAIEEGKRIAHDKNVKAYKNIDDLRNSLEV